MILLQITSDFPAAEAKTHEVETGVPEELGFLLPRAGRELPVRGQPAWARAGECEPCMSLAV